MEDKKKLKTEKLKAVNGGADSDYGVHVYTQHFDDDLMGELGHFSYRGQWNKLKAEFCERCGADVVVEVSVDPVTQRETHRCTRNPAHLWYVDN